MLAARPTSMRASFIGLPASSAMSRASSSSRDSIMLAASIRTTPRAAGSVAFHSGRASAAASIARSVSALSDLGGPEDFGGVRGVDYLRGLARVRGNPLAADEVHGFYL